MVISNNYSKNYFDLQDFLNRWQRARFSAIEKVLVKSQKTAVFSNEITGLQNIPNESRELLLKTVFGHSQTLAKSYSRYIAGQWGLSELHEFLINSKVPCLSGAQWEIKKHAFVARREACREFSKIGSFYCEYWREALDGIVMGLCHSERMARHASVGCGDRECVDVFYSEEQETELIRFKEIPASLQKLIDQIKNDFSHMNAHLKIEGIAENILYYQIISENPTCGNKGEIFHRRLKMEVNKIYPNLQLKDATPLAVVGEG